MIWSAGRILLIAVFVVLAVAIAVLFDSPTSVFLLCGLAIAATGVAIGAGRGAR